MKENNLIKKILLIAMLFLSSLSVYASNITAAISLLLEEEISLDETYLYQKSDISISIPSDRKSFEIVRNSDGKVLRNQFAGETFYKNSNPNITIDYYIMRAAAGGVDIHYTLKNSSSEEQSLADVEFRVEGIEYTIDSQNALNVLDLFEYHNIKAMQPTILAKNNSKNHIDISLGYPYPVSYSPVILGYDDFFAAGSSLQYAYLNNEKIRPSMIIEEDSVDSWAHVYKFNYPLTYAAGNNIKYASNMKANSTVQVTLSFRIAKPRNWLMTLYPYKKYFNRLYGTQRDIVDRGDRKPINGIQFAYPSVPFNVTSGNAWDYIGGSLVMGNNISNPLGFNTNYQVYLEQYGGLETLLTEYISDLVESGYTRTMIWTFSGVYNTCLQDDLIDPYRDQTEINECNTNYPHQFISNLNDPMQQALNNGALSTFNEHGIDLGFWWGRAGQIPEDFIDNNWNPETMTTLDPSNQSHRSFALGELSIATSKGADDIGLDAIGQMPINDRLSWIDTLKANTDSVRFMSEGSSTTNDIMHSRTSIMIQPKHFRNIIVNSEFNNNENQQLFFYLLNSVYPNTNLTMPPLFLQYINPNAEIVPHILTSTPDKTYIQNLVSWGYTPLIMSPEDITTNDPFNVGNLNYNLVECFDGIDNDNDGLIDFPYNLDCSSASDSTE